MYDITCLTVDMRCTDQGNALRVLSTSRAVIAHEKESKRLGRPSRFRKDLTGTRRDCRVRFEPSWTTSGVSYAMSTTQSPSDGVGLAMRTFGATGLTDPRG
jgi:hypothetical protein